MFMEKIGKKAKILGAIACVAVVSLVLSLTTQAADPVKVAASWGGDEEAGFRKVLDAFTKKTGYEVEYEGIGSIHVALKSRVAAGNAPDIAMMPRPGEVAALARQGVLADIEPMLNMQEMTKNFGRAWIDLGRVDGKLVALITKAYSKSLVWYRTDILNKYTKNAPTTWTGFNELAKKMYDDGLPPHSIAGIKAWTLTDVFENIYVRTAGEKNYLDLFTKHKVKWTDSSVKEAMKYFADIVGREDYIAGGRSVALSLHYRDTMAQVLKGEAGTFLGAGFLKNYAPKEKFGDITCGKEFGAFPFPSIKKKYKNAVLGAGDLAIAFNNKKGTAALVNYLSTAEAMTIWASSDVGPVVTPHKGVPSSVYEPCTRLEANQLKNADPFVFDGSDLAPGAVGGDALPSGLQQFVAEPQEVDEILQNIENVAARSY